MEWPLAWACTFARSSENQFLVFAMNCAHLGCPVTWFPQSGLFMCPCHGGVYYEDGQRASGPPTRGLFQCVMANNERRIRNPVATPSHSAAYLERVRESLRTGDEAHSGMV